VPRSKRICFPGAVYHIFQRGNNKEEIFVDDIDRWHFLKLCLEAKAQFSYVLYCYVLMKNHFHLTIETPNSTPISKIMHFIMGSYAAYFNERHDHIGHLFQGRFKDIIVEREAYLLELSRYVHLNPVRAGLTLLPEDYKWSSYNIYIGARKDILVDADLILEKCDAIDRKNARNKYKSFVEAATPKIQGEEDWLEKNLRYRRFLASKDFVKRGQAPFVLEKSAGLC